eukprot:TRINITY_DN13235_c0_g1_i7.p1 TRINITY_DN13235_c0_g1~~TRINITY_DN13235_c0_g1_i7.p1  ORF type:complete len:800 (+),score=93.80 TRINITY_DN13235_c0_g1_i7:26-2425(+)
MDMFTIMGQNLENLEPDNDMEETKLHCDQCNFSCSSSTNLKTHLLLEHDVIRFPCEVCGMIYSSGNTYKAHKQSVHGAGDQKAERSEAPVKISGSREIKEFKVTPRKDPEVSSSIMVETIDIKEEWDFQAGTTFDNQADATNLQPNIRIKVKGEPETKELRSCKMEATSEEWEEGNTEQECPDDYQLLKEFLEEAKSCAEKAQHLTVKLSKDVLSTSNVGEYLTQVTSSIDQAVISTTQGLSALESILLIREEEFGSQDVEMTDPLIEENVVPVQESPVISTQKGNDVKKKKYQCKDCDFSSDKEHPYRKHRREHQGMDKFKCKDCDYTAPKTYTVRSHMKKSHQIDDGVSIYVLELENPDVKHYMCSKCSYSSTSEVMLLDHVLDQHGDGGSKEELATSVEGIGEAQLYKCTKCPYESTNKIYFDDHMNCGMKYRKCPWCDFHSSKMTTMRVHLKKNHGVWNKEENGFQCPDCNTKFGSKNSRNLFKHMHLKHQVGPLLHCPSCNYSHVLEINMQLHMEDHNEANIYCSKCPYRAKSEHRLKKHIRQVHGPDIVCDGCGFEYQTIEALKLHKKKHCGNRISRLVNLRKQAGDYKRHNVGIDYHSEKKCNECGNFTTTNYRYLKKHLFEEHQYTDAKYKEYLEKYREKPYKCDECDYEASQHCLIKIHKEQKHPTGKVTCDVCHLEFKLKTTLTAHKKRMHSQDQKMYSCEEPGCSYKSNESFRVKYHREKVHLGIRWPCDHCDYLGPYKGDLTRHLKKVHNIHPEGSKINCDLCDFNSINAATMKAHKKKVHNIDIEN